MQILILLAGIVLLAAGAILLPTPLPFGVPFLVIGCALVLTASPGLRVKFKRWRARHPKVSALLLKYEPRLPAWLRTAMHDTRPDGM